MIILSSFTRMARYLEWTLRYILKTIGPQYVVFKMIFMIFALFNENTIFLSGFAELSIISELNLFAFCGLNYFL